MYKESNRPILKAFVYVQNSEVREKLKPMGRLLLELSGDGDLSKELRDILEIHHLYAEECLFLATTMEEIKVAESILMAVTGLCVSEAAEPIWGTSMVFEGIDSIEEQLLVRTHQRQYGAPWLIAKTKRCILRELAIEDLSELIDLYDQPGIAYRINEQGEREKGFVEPLYSLEEEWEYQVAYIDNMYRCFEYGLWLVLDKESGQLIGRAGIENREFKEGVEQELGYLIDPAWQRKGIATEVCECIISYAKEILGCNRLNLLVEKANIPSIKLAKKLGFSYLEDMEVGDSILGRYVLQLAEK